MIKQNGYLENLLCRGLFEACTHPPQVITFFHLSDYFNSFPKLIQSNSVPIQMYVPSELDWVSFGKLTGFQGSPFCVWRWGPGRKRVLVVRLCVSKYVGEWDLNGSQGCGSGCIGVGGVGWVCVCVRVCVWVGGWVSFGQVA